MSTKAWQEEDANELIELYTSEENTNIQDLAEYFGKSPRSVISKLVQLKIYKKPHVRESRTVKMMIREIEKTLDIEIEGFNLNKKENLVRIVDGLRDKLSNSEVA